MTTVDAFLLCDAAGATRGNTFEHGRLTMRLGRLLGAALPPDLAQVPQSTAPQSTEPLSRDDEVARLQARLAAVERERDHLAAIVDILQEVSSSLHFIDVLQTIARKLGETCYRGGGGGSSKVKLQEIDTRGRSPR